MLDQGQLKARICALWHAGSTMDSARKALAEVSAAPRLPATLGDDRLFSCGVKIYLDGSGGARTGWVYDDWLRNAKTPDVTTSARPIAATRKPISPFTAKWSDSFTRDVCRSARMPLAIAPWIGSSIPTQCSGRKSLSPVYTTASSTPTCRVDALADLQKKYDAGYPEMQPEFL